MTLNVAAADTINAEIERSYGAGNGTAGSPRFIPSENLQAAREEADHLTKVAETMAEDVPQLARWAAGRMAIQNLLVVELGQLHPFELQTIATVLARAIARRDPARIDGRFSENAQKLADPFRAKGA